MPMLKQPEFLNREITTGKNYAYIKIGEDVVINVHIVQFHILEDHLSSRKMEDIIEEAKMLAKKRYKRVDSNSTRYNKIWGRHIWKI